MAGILVISGFFFWILDIDEWDSAVGNVVRFITISAMFSVFVLLVILVSNDLPFGIITLFAVINPLWLLAVKVSAQLQKLSIRWTDLGECRN